MLSPSNLKVRDQLELITYIIPTASKWGFNPHLVLAAAYSMSFPYRMQDRRFPWLKRRHVREKRFSVGIGAKK